VECQVCGNPSHNRTIVVEEMMIGLRDRFEYLECKSCGCAQRLASVAILLRIITAFEQSGGR